MKFYLTQTAAGPRYARTKEDAKALDPKFTLVEYPTDQAALVERFNTLLASVPATAMGESVAAPPPEPADEPEEAAESPAKRRKGAEATSATDWGLAPPAGSCERCTAMSAASRDMEGIMAATNIEWALHHADMAFLDRIEKAIGERRTELAA